MADDKVTLYKPLGAPFTVDRRLQFLEYLTSHEKLGGRVGLCAQAVGVSLSTVTEHRKKDPGFNEAVLEAQQLWAENFLLSSAIERAVNGVSRPIYGGKYKDVQVGEERIYSDHLMGMLLKAKIPEFRADTQVNVTQSMAGGVLVIPAAPTCATEWQQQFGELAKGETGRND